LIKLKQETPLSNATQLIYSEKMFNINLTYGLFCNFHRTMASILKVEEYEKRDNVKRVTKVLSASTKKAENLIEDDEPEEI